MMALVHDMAESIVGDITPHDGVSKGTPQQGLLWRRLIAEEKHRREVEAMKHLASLLPDAFSTNAKVLQELFEEYEAGATTEAILVKDIDKYELLVQAVEYERDTIQRGEKLEGLKDLSSFYGVSKGITSDIVKGWAQDVLQERESLRSDAKVVTGAE
jgi:putative hydrolases of HD superfamily